MTDQMGVHEPSRLPYLNFAPDACRLMMSEDYIFLNDIAEKYRRPPFDLLIDRDLKTPIYMNTRI